MYKIKPSPGTKIGDYFYDAINMAKMTSAMVFVEFDGTEVCVYPNDTPFILNKRWLAKREAS